MQLRIFTSSLAAVTLLAANLITSAIAADSPEPAELTRLRGQLYSSIDKAGEALGIFWRNYTGKLSEMERNSKGEAAFEAIPAIEAEMKNAQNGVMGRDSAYAPLRELQLSYGKIYTQLIQQFEPQRIPLVATYSAALDNLERSLRQQNRSEDALKVHSERVALEQGTLRTRPAAPAPVASLPGASAGSAIIAPSFTNTLGMKFVPVPGTTVLFCIHDTRKGDYRKYAEANPAVNNAWTNIKARVGPVSEGDEHPVVMVSWDEAKAFCAWLSSKEGRTYRLPTDHEWSIAVGIGDQEAADAVPKSVSGKIHDVFPWGTEWPPPAGTGNFADIALKDKAAKTRIIDGYNDGYATTSPVMSFKPNKLGLYDMAGNVWQWCEDKLNSKDEIRVMRGGSWYDFNRNFLLSSYRGSRPPAQRRDIYGFRVVVVK